LDEFQTTLFSKCDSQRTPLTLSIGDKADPQIGLSRGEEMGSGKLLAVQGGGKWVFRPPQLNESADCAERVDRNSTIVLGALVIWCPCRTARQPPQRVIRRSRICRRLPKDL